MSLEIKSNGETVWINRERCLARITKRAYEIMDPRTERMTGVQKAVSNVEFWEEFAAKVKQTYNIVIPNEKRPIWAV
jgi:hypothetical protein